MTAYIARNDGALDWDAWRAGYDEMSFADQQAFYKRVAVHYPTQAHCDYGMARGFFDEYQPERVTELGGWAGHLAERMLDEYPVKLWVNYDLVVVPQVCTGPRYRLNVLAHPLWDTAGVGPADAFVATHVIEHIKLAELRKLVASLRVAACLIESPLGPQPTDWAGYCGTHILEVGWDGVDEVFAEAGFAPATEWGVGRYYAR